MSNLNWVFLSPHFDDVVLSCGGLAWEQVQAGQHVEIWTVCAGSPPDGAPLSDFARSLHARWESGPAAVEVRRQEDEAAGRVLGAHTRYYDLPDCIYRRLPDGSFLVNGEEDLWQPVHRLESGVVAALRGWLQSQLAAAPAARLVCPMTLGSHVDHHLVRAAAQGAVEPERLWFYADYPYAVRHPQALQAILQPDWTMRPFAVSESGLAVWQQAIAQHRSQISTFWPSLDEMRAALRAYWQAGGGCVLWQGGAPKGE